LSLTPEQIARVRAIQNQTGTHGPRFGPPGWGGGEGRKAALEKILGELTPAQRREWDDLVGRDVPLRAFRPAAASGAGRPRATRRAAAESERRRGSRKRRKDAKGKTGKQERKEGQEVDVSC